MPKPPEFVEVNLPFNVSHVDYDESKPYFEKNHPLCPGMLLDCEVEREGRQYILIGDLNCSLGHCGCCSSYITFVYRFYVYPLPKL